MPMSNLWSIYICFPAIINNHARYHIQKNLNSISAFCIGNFSSCITKMNENNHRSKSLDYFQQILGIENLHRGQCAQKYITK
jgi:hypothetical protein